MRAGVSWSSPLVQCSLSSEVAAVEVAAGVVAVGAVCVVVVVVVVADLVQSQEGNPEIVLLRVVPSCRGAPASWCWNVSL